MSAWDVVNDLGAIVAIVLGLRYILGELAP